MGLGPNQGQQELSGLNLSVGFARARAIKPRTTSFTNRGFSLKRTALKFPEISFRMRNEQIRSHRSLGLTAQCAHVSTPARNCRDCSKS